MNEEIQHLQQQVTRLETRLQQTEKELTKLRSSDNVRYVNLGTNVVRRRNIAPQSVTEEHLNVGSLKLGMGGYFQFGSLVTTGALAQAGHIPAKDVDGTVFNLLTG